MADTDLVFEEKAQHEKGFAAYFDTHVKPKLLDLEFARIRAGRALWTRIAVTVGVVVAGAIVLYFVHPWRPEYFYWGLGAWLVILVFLIWYTRRPFRLYALKRKNTLIPSVLAFFGEFDYDPRGKISSRVLKDSHLFEDWDKYTSEDLISGTHHGRSFDFAEARLSRRRRKGESKRFRGYILALELAEEAKGVTIGLFRKGEAVTDFEQLIERTRGLTLDRFTDFAGADAEEDEGFEVYATDFDETRLLLSDALMQSLQRIGTLHEANSLEFGINKQVFLLKIETKHDLFGPPSLYRSTLSTDGTRLILEEVYLVLAVVDEVARGTQVNTN